MSLSVTTKLTIYDTPSVIYDEFARVFVPQENGGTRWINIVTREGVEMTLFARDAMTVDAPAEMAS